MKIVKTNFKGIHILEYQSFKDNRGEFVKTIHKETFQENQLDWSFTESFYSVSHKNVLRGMHFQYFPNEHDKLVSVISGRILDVVLDLRVGSESFGKSFSIELNKENRLALFIEKGFAHGFLSLENDTIVEYHTTTSQHKNSEGGVKWDSFGFDWPITEPVLSLRDTQFQPFNLNSEYL